MKLVIITGSREGLTSDGLIWMEDLISKLPGDAVVLHGGQRGADATAEAICRRHRVTCVKVPATGAWPDAGPARNEDIAAVATILQRHLYEPECHAYPGPKSRGTWSMVGICKRAGWPVFARRGGGR